MTDAWPKIMQFYFKILFTLHYYIERIGHHLKIIRWFQMLFVPICLSPFFLFFSSICAHAQTPKYNRVRERTHGNMHHAQCHSVIFFKEFIYQSAFLPFFFPPHNFSYKRLSNNSDGFFPGVHISRAVYIQLVISCLARSLVLHFL